MERPLAAVNMWERLAEYIVMEGSDSRPCHLVCCV